MGGSSYHSFQLSQRSKIVPKGYWGKGRFGDEWRLPHGLCTPKVSRVAPQSLCSFAMMGILGAQENKPGDTRGGGFWELSQPWLRVTAKGGCLEGKK